MMANEQLYTKWLEAAIDEAKKVEFHYVSKNRQIIARKLYQEN